MATEIQLNHIPHQPHKQLIEELDSSYSSGEVSVPMGIGANNSTIASAPKKECCDYIVLPEKQPNCWQRLSPCKKTTICCGGVVVAGGGTLGALIGTGTISASGGGLAAIIIIGVCCSVKLAVGAACCYAKFSSQDK